MDHIGGRLSARMRAICAEMARRLMVLLAAALAAPAALAEDAAPALLFLPPLPEAEAADFLAVGRINRAGFRELGGCTGTLIRPDVVLTAGHCTGSADGDTWVFVTGWRRGEYHMAMEVVEASRHPAYRIGGRHDPRFDLGLLFLAAPMADVTPLSLTQEGMTLPDRAALVGYHHRTPHLMTGQLDCPLLERTDRLAAYGCPVVSGNSGGPVLIPGENDGWQVAGVLSSRFTSASDGPGALGVIEMGWVREALARHDRGGD